MRLPLPLGKKTGQAKVASQSVERIINGYLEAVTDGKEPDPVYGTPGLVAWSTGLDGAVRGMVEMTGQVYAVAGTKLYRIAIDGQASILGEVPGSDVVALAGDGTNLVMVAGGKIYVYDGSALNMVTDPDAPSASSVTWLDQYFIFGETDQQTFFISELADPENYDALDFAAAEWKPDKIVAPVVLKRTLYLFGEKSIEAQQNVGGADFPFQRFQDLFIDVGLAGRDAVVTSNDTIYWLAHDLTIRRLDGITATRISDYASEKLIKTWSNTAATIATAHVWEGHLFIVFRNPEGCIVFDQSTQRFHERRSEGSETWRVRHFAECYRMCLFGSASAGTIYKLDADAFDEDGETLPFEVVTPYAYNGGLRLTVNEVEVIAQTGVGSLTLNPQISLERTEDGETFGSRVYRALGKIGERTTRVIFGPQGQSRAMAFKLRITDPVRRAILGIHVDVDSE